MSQQRERSRGTVLQNVSFSVLNGNTFFNLDRRRENKNHHSSHINFMNRFSHVKSAQNPRKSETVEAMTNNSRKTSTAISWSLSEHKNKVFLIEDAPPPRLKPKDSQPNLEKHE
jgi:hypothetical protein